MKHDKFKFTDIFIKELLRRARLELEITAELTVINTGYIIYAVLTIKHGKQLAQRRVDITTYDDLFYTGVELVEELYLKS